MTPPILVTGATGKVGGAMVKRLLAGGAQVRAAAHYPDRGAADRHDPVDWIEIDFNRRDTLAPAFRGVDKAVLITPEDVAMVCQTAELLDAARAAGVSKVVRVSFMNAGDDGAGGPLLAWHREAEKAGRGVGHPVHDPASQLLHAELRDHLRAQHPPEACLLHAHGEGTDQLRRRRSTSAMWRSRCCWATATRARRTHSPGRDSLLHDEIAEILTREVGRPIRYVDVGEDEACNGAAPARRAAGGHCRAL